MGKKKKFEQKVHVEARHAWIVKNKKKKSTTHTEIWRKDIKLKG